MKTISLLPLVGLAVLASNASASPQPEAAVFVLPPYVVYAPLLQPAEQKVNISLTELRNEARRTDFAATLPSLDRSAILRANLPKMSSRGTKPIQVARL